MLILAYYLYKKYVKNRIDSLISTDRNDHFQGEAVRLIDQGMAPKIIQTAEGATYDAMMKKSNAEVSKIPEFENVFASCQIPCILS